MFRTPHTEKLHVVERFKVTADNKFLEALVKIEDEDTFNEPMYATKRWRKDPNVWGESICAENSDYSTPTWCRSRARPGRISEGAKAPSPRARCEPISTHSLEARIQVRLSVHGTTAAVVPAQRDP